MRVIVTFRFDFGSWCCRKSTLFLSIINPVLEQRERGRERAAHEILVLKSDHRRIMSQPDSTSRRADEEDKGG